MARFAYADYEGAEKDFLEAVELGGSEEKPYSYLGMLYRATGVPRKALDAFTRVLSTDPYHIESLIGTAQALYDLGDAAEAEAPSEQSRQEARSLKPAFSAS